MIKAVIFDMDGVLVDNRDVHIEAFQQLFDKYGLAFDREKFMPSFGMTNDQIFKWQAPELLERFDVEQLGREKEELYRALFEKAIAPTRGLIGFLDDLKSRGLKLAVGSSGPQSNVDFVLARCGIADYFDAVANGDMITRGKPDPEVYLLAAEKLGIPPGECVVCEDAPVGIEAARAAGMHVVALTTTFPREKINDYDFLIDDFTQINSIQVVDILR